MDKCLLVDEEGLKKYMGNTFFPAYYTAERTKEFDASYLPINETIYLVLSNRQSVTTTVYVYVSIDLYEDKGNPKRPDTIPSDGLIRELQYCNDKV